LPVLGDARAVYRRTAQRRVPALILWGARDEVSPVRNGHELAGVMRAVRYLEIPSGHLTHYERPDLTNPAILHRVTRMFG
jgi:pimeloyl-ACP methyl ester carboxylesterase